MQRYELLLLFSTSLDDREREAVHERILKTLKEAGGEIFKNELVGKRKLAYEVRHERFGVYLLMEFDLEHTALNNVESLLRGTQEVLRYLLVKKRVKTQEEIEKEQRIRERIEQKRIAAESKEREKAIEEARAEEEKKPLEEKKITLEELDKKLDEILKEDLTK